MGIVSRRFSRACRNLRRKNLLNLIRLEFLCKGLVYLMTGVLAVMIALYGADGSSASGTVLERLARSAPGTLALAIITAGMLTYATWRFLCAFSGSDHRRRYHRSFRSRVAQFGAGTVYTLIALCALSLLVGSADPVSPAEGKLWTAGFLAQTSGRIAAGTIGISMIAGSVFQIRRGFYENFRRDIRTLTLSPGGKRWARRAGICGHAARGIVFGLVGTFLIFTAGTAASGESRGLETTLENLATEPLGQSLLLIVAAGLVCYGIWCMVEARYRRIPY